MRLTAYCVGALCAALVLVSCGGTSHPKGAASVGKSAAATPASGPDDPLEGLQCEPARAGYARSCKSGDYEVSGTPTDCNIDTASLGSVRERSSLLAGLPSGTRSARVAELSEGQLVCIHYSADSNRDAEAWSYVTAIDATMVSACGRRCSTAAKPVVWIGEAPLGICSHTGSGYSEACASGWIRREAIEEYSMGLAGQQGGESLGSDTKALAGTLPGVTINAVAGSATFTCVVGAKSDDLGQETAVAAGFVARSASPAWVLSIPHDPDFYQSRATHCACTADRCYVLVATDTQAAQSTSQTLLSVVQISRDGRLSGTRDLKAIPGAPANASSWVDPGNRHFVLEAHVLIVEGAWRTSDADDAHPFTMRFPLY